MGRRTVEPRLSGGQTWQECPKVAVAGRHVPQARCATAPSPNPSCVHHADDADPLRLLAEEPDCTDEAVEALQRISAAEPAALSDLAAAYYIRAQQQDRASDLLRAYDAIHAAPDTPEARYNRAVIEEALGVHASWDEFLEKESDSPWADEAHRRRRPRPAEAFAQWTTTVARALQSRDAESASRLIAPFPGVAQVHFEDELLVPGADLATLQIFADALFLRTEDPLARDIVQALRADTRGIAEYHTGRSRQMAMQNPKMLLLQASGLLRAAGNPLHLVAQFRQVWGEASEPGNQPHVRAILDRIEPEVRRRGYRHLLGRIHSLRAYCLGYEGDFVGSLAEYERAWQHFEALHDFDSIPGTRSRIAGVLRVAGDVEAAAREIVRALRDEHRIVTTREQQNVNGEVSKVARALGLPHAAWHYADSIVTTYRARLAGADPADTDELSRLQKELSIALGNRAAMAVELQDYESANVDLAEAQRQSEQTKINPDIRRLTDIAFYEIRGQASLLTPKDAIAAYTRALSLAEGDTFRTTRASLYAQRAEAFSRDGREAEAGADLRRTVLELEAEEHEIVAKGGPRSNDKLPPGYYARFQDTYLHLIRHYVDRGDVVQSLMYAEYSRGAETKKLLARLQLRGPVAESMEHFRSIRARLPQDSALLLYSVMEDRTYVWVVTAARTSVHRLDVTAQDVGRWARALYRAERRRRLDEFEEGLEAPYAKLFAPILKHIGQSGRLIIVPDGAMHGLPFVALRNPDDDHYLIQDYVIETAPSATLYAYARVRDAMLQKSARPSIMVMGNPAFDRTLPLVHAFSGLPHAEREAAAIAAFYGTGALTGAAATVPAFLDGVEGMDLVHFAGHAVVNPVTPSASYLLMARSPEHSGVLTAAELLARLKLDRTRLVVLSACSSAGGGGVGSEGVAPLVRPILTAGVPAVIGSLWSVNDATTERLLVSFHQHYRQHKDAAVALRDAQLIFIGSRNRNLSSGFAWAPFQVIGHASSPLAPTPQTDKGEPP